MTVLVGHEAPNFNGPAVLGDGSIVDDFSLLPEAGTGYRVVFFYPLDFTFVCPSELIAFDKRLEEFSKRNTTVVGVSVDSHFTHNAWRNTPVEKGGIGQVGYPLMADLSHEICQTYGVEAPGASVALRGSFLIDKNLVVRHQVVNDLPLGRNVDEMLRMVDALRFHEEHGEVCPAGWQEGRPGMKATPEGVADYLAKEAGKL